MGYGSVYGNRMVSYLKPREVRFLDRLFLKALVRTRFGSQLMENNVIEGSRVNELDGALELYKQVGANIFWNNEFAFRNFSDAKEYNMPVNNLKEAPLLSPSRRIERKLQESIDNALVEVERRCTPSETKPDAIYEDADFRNGAWQLYSEVRELVTDMLPTMRDRRTIKRKCLALDSNEKGRLGQLIGFYNKKVA